MVHTQTPSQIRILTTAATVGFLIIWFQFMHSLPVVLHMIGAKGSVRGKKEFEPSSLAPRIRA
eukprot:COSAG02_NODE_8205_length_2660_cov_1.470910_1_plen_62_part_10